MVLMHLFTVCLKTKIMMMENLGRKSNKCKRLLPNIVVNKHQKEIIEEMNLYAFAVRYY